MERMTVTAGLPMVGRICVVTGASSGIGKAASIALARLGASVVLVCRDQGRGEAARAEIAAAGSRGQPSLELADLSCLNQVRALAVRLARLPRIDVLVNNAGLIGARRRTSADGFEYTLAVNHLAPFLLTNLLTPTLRASAPARVVTVSSVAHRAGLLNLDDLQLERHYLPMLAYANSKLANILFTRELARQLDGTGVTANCLHPGTVASRFGDTGAAWLRLGLAIGRAFLRSTESGARTVVYLAASPHVAGQTGGYYVNARRRNPSRAARNDILARQLWDISACLTGLTSPT
jgi:retinol dehydrogenase-12